MSAPLPLVSRSFPARIADLGFSAELPADWPAHDLPEETLDFNDPTRFVPLALLSAPHAAVVFLFAARPAYDDGTLHDWCWYLLRHNQLEPRAVGPAIVAGVPAMIGEATQVGELGTMVVRFAFFEDGGRLVNITLAAPELFADTLRDAWHSMLASFRLALPRGSRFVAEANAEAVPAPAVRVAPTAKPASTAPAADPADGSVAESEVVTYADPDPTPPAEHTFAEFAIAADAGSLDPEQQTNANLRNRGAGLVPNVVAIDTEARRATVAAAAITAQFDLPLGWHVIDDGRRTLVFEPSGKVQIHLSLLRRDGRLIDEVLDELETQVRADYPAPEFVRISAGAVQALGARNLFDGEQPLEQYHMLLPWRDDSLVLRARVTATPETAVDACNLAELILLSCVFPGADAESGSDARAATQATAPTGPVWWQEAQRLEQQDQLEAAEQHVRQHCPHIGFAATMAELYRNRMLRLTANGDAKGAAAAFHEANEWIGCYASQATSGGEGEALSLERDEFRARLRAEFDGRS